VSTTTDSFKRMLTEERNSRTMDLDVLDTADLVKRIQSEDLEVARAVASVSGEIAKAVDLATERLLKGGRMIYFGAGTSGRLGVLDATECSPTFGVDSQTVQAYIAGGKQAMFQSFENAEDSEELGSNDADSAAITSNDLVVGIAASGRTPYVLGALKKAKENNAAIVVIVNNPNSKLGQIADVLIEALVGPEALTGSTRMKAGTAQKMILNLLSTATMIRLGKVYENLMVDLKPTNEKLRERASSIICTVCDVERHVAEGALVASGNKVKTAILMLKRKVGRVQAEQLLTKSNNKLRQALTAELS
jgi:N-acetylmuramic acid 6-phosphate etherase